MPTAAGIDNLKIGNWNMKFGASGVDIGILDNVDPTAWKLKTLDIEAGSFGPIKLGRWIVGMEGPVKGEIREFDIAKIRKLMPWAPVSGSIPFMPATDAVDSYTLADKLVLHPNWLPASSTDLDLTFLKAFPMFNFAALDGKKNNNFNGVEFEMYPDRAVLVTSGTGALVKSYGYVGPVPT